MYWSGLLNQIDTQPAAEPYVGERREDRSYIWSSGSLTSLAALRLAELVFQESRRPGTRVIYVALNSQCGMLGGLHTAASVLGSIPESVSLIAWLGVACGPALWLAMHFPLVIAHPTAPIGCLQCGTRDGEFDPDRTSAFCDEFAQLYRCVIPATWERLTQHLVTGEQAEAMGIVGTLRREFIAPPGVTK